MVNNLTEGKPLKLLFFFAMPMVVGNLFQQLYNMVDSMVVGRFVGEDALAAVGSSFPVVFLSVAIAAGLSMGCTVVISQFFGAGNCFHGPHIPGSEWTYYYGNRGNHRGTSADPFGNRPGHYG